MEFLSHTEVPRDWEGSVCPTQAVPSCMRTGPHAAPLNGLPVVYVSAGVENTLKG